MRSSLSALLAAFLATSSMTVASIALVQTAAAQPSEDQAIGAFFDTGYGWCDAKVLSQYWNTDPTSAKVMAGEKILRGDARVLDEALGTAYASFRCQVAFDFQDMRDVAQLWGAVGQG